LNVESSASVSAGPCTLDSSSVISCQAEDAVSAPNREEACFMTLIRNTCNDSDTHAITRAPCNEDRGQGRHLPVSGRLVLYALDHAILHLLVCE